MTGKFEGEYEIESPGEEEVPNEEISNEGDAGIVDKLDDFIPADIVYDQGGIQIYQNDNSTIMLKVIGTNPLRFVSLFVERKISNDAIMEEFDGVQGQGQETEEVNQRR